jgi:uncharacterized membrane protein
MFLERGRKIWQFLQKHFLYGLVALLPIYVTVRVAIFVIHYVDQSAAPILQAYLPVHIPGLGLIVTLLIVLLAGMLMRLVVVRQATRHLERYIESVPGVRSVYGAVKQVVSPLLGDDDHKAFQQVVGLEWPGNDLWVVGFLVKDEHEVQGPDDEVLVFLPTNHLHLGFVMATRRSKLHPIEMSIEEALKMQFSLGVASPDVPIMPGAIYAPPVLGVRSQP